MNLKSFFIVAAMILSLILSAKSFAGLIDWEVRNRYLKEQEEQTKKPSQASSKAENLPQWMQVEPIVRTEDEKKFDANKDGRFQPVETKVYLRRATQEIQDGTGKNVQDSQVLKEYDANKDGIITKPESEKMKKDAF